VSARARRRQRRHVELPSAGQTIASLTLRSVDEAGPWPLTRVLTALTALDVERVGVARALGDRRGIPLVHSQELRWREQSLFIEARHSRGGFDELSVELPPWDELVAEVDQDEVWALLDTVAAGADAHFGSIGDGEPPETSLPDDAGMLGAQLRRHLALLLPHWASEDAEEAGGSVARLLEASGLVLVIP
jgi:hypothetical protein